MVDPKLEKIWKVAKSNIEFARKALPEPDDAIREQYQCLLKEYFEYIDHNELELALDMLGELGEIVSCRGGFWKNLERAAEVMKLNDRIPYYKSKYKEALSRIKNRKGR